MYITSVKKGKSIDIDEEVQSWHNDRFIVSDPDVVPNRVILVRNIKIREKWWDEHHYNVWCTWTVQPPMPFCHAAREAHTARERLNSGARTRLFIDAPTLFLYALNLFLICNLCPTRLLPRKTNARECQLKTANIRIKGLKLHDYEVKFNSEALRPQNIKNFSSVYCSLRRASP